MARIFPFSIWLFVLAGLVLLFLVYPISGVVLLMLGGIFWPGFLINLGMIGTTLEGLSGRVHRAWLILPLVFYGAYFSFVAAERIALASLQSSYDLINSKVQVPFDQSRYSLVFENSAVGVRLVTDYDLAFTFSKSKNTVEGYRSARMAEKETCDLIRILREEQPFAVRTDFIYDDDDLFPRLRERRFCTVSLNEKPTLSVVRVKRTSKEAKHQTLLSELPVRLNETTITLPDGEAYMLKGGTASPLPLFPTPMMGCALISAGPSWQCFAMFYRDKRTPIVTGSTRYGRDTGILARALGLKSVRIADRAANGHSDGIDSTLAAVIQQVLTRQIDDIRALVDAPTSRELQSNFEVLAQNEAALFDAKDDVMAALEAVAFYEGENSFIARDNGRTLFDYLMLLPDEQFAPIQSRVVALFEQAPSENWMWEMSEIRERIEMTGVVLAH